MTQLEQIMTSNPVVISPHANIHKARMLMAENSIRHMPVKDGESGIIVGLLTQKVVLVNAIKTINERGFEELEHVQKSINVASVMDTDIAIFDISADLKDVAQSLLSKRSGCVILQDNNKLVGVITSRDFVKLAAK